MALQVRSHAGGRASARGVLLLQRGKLFPGAEPGRQRHRQQPERPFLGGRQQKRRWCHLWGAACWHTVPPASAWQAPAVPGDSGSSPGKGHGPRLAINHSPRVCPLALTSAGRRLIDYSFNPTSP